MSPGDAWIMSGEDLPRWASKEKEAVGVKSTRTKKRD